MTPITPTEAQLEVRNEPSLSALILAPAGCGKTEALALRIQGIIERQQSCPPKRILVVAFSNKARDNIKERVIEYIGASSARTLVTFQNLHGLSSRIYTSHSYLLNLDPQATPPENRWLLDQLKERHVGSADRKLIQFVLRDVKQQALTDKQVLAELNRRQQPVAVSIENARQTDNRLTYDDLPRLAEIILQNSNVAAFYQNHFSCVIVDEFQDLTPQQLRIVQAIGSGKTTFAGDLAQGIYGFAGASPDAVLVAIRKEIGREIIFNESHRSSPRVLEGVNSLAKFIGGQTLTSAKPNTWIGGGMLGIQGFGDVHVEAAWIVKTATQLLKRFPWHRIGIITRIAGRAVTIDAAMQNFEFPVHRWKDPLYNQYVARQLKFILRNVSEQEFQTAPNKITYLWSVTEPLEDQDPETKVQLQEAFEWAIELYSAGTSLTDISSRIKTGDSDTLLKAAGVHILNVHTGKGQQFDWVIAVGLEQGTLPFALAITEEEQLEELRVFSVMLSRARFGVIVTHSNQVLKWDKMEQATPSRFLEPLRVVSGILDGEGFHDRLNAGVYG